MTDINDTIGIESLLAAAIRVSGGVITVDSEDLTSPEVVGKYIGLDLNPDNTITMSLIDYDEEKTE